MTPVQVKLFKATFVKKQSPDGHAILEKPKVPLDTQINEWVKEAGVTIVSTSIGAFPVVEQAADKTIVRKTVFMSQVSYLPEKDFLQREADIRAKALGVTVSEEVPEQAEETPAYDYSNGADTEAGGPEQPMLAPTDEDEFEG